MGNAADIADAGGFTSKPHARIVLDVHTHHAPPQPEGIVAIDPQKLPDQGTYPHQFYSVGIHPWDLRGIALSAEQLQQLRDAARRVDVAAIGETGIDLVHPGAAPLATQMNAFRTHVEISEAVGKPLVIHCVKAQQMIIGVKREMNPKQTWIVHGFRGKPTVLKMLTDEGICVSYGAAFNPLSLDATPADMILAETDDDPQRIQDIIASLNVSRPDVTPDLIAANMRRIFGEMNALNQDEDS